MEENLCYVVSPPLARLAEWRKAVFDVFTYPAAVQSGYQCILGLPMGASGSPIDAIIGPLLEADLVVIDVTGHNDPAMFYQLGVRHALAERTIIIAQSETDILQDFRPYNVIIFSKDFNGVGNFKSSFQDIINHINANQIKLHNPVQSYLIREKQLPLFSALTTKIDAIKHEYDTLIEQARRSSMQQLLYRTLFFY